MYIMKVECETVCHDGKFLHRSIAKPIISKSTAIRIIDRWNSLGRWNSQQLPRYKYTLVEVSDNDDDWSYPRAK